MGTQFMNDTLVMKFGGASVATIDHFSIIADIILTRSVEHPSIVVVISAMGETTNQLIGLANYINEKPPQREYDMLISVGERISMALLAMALLKKNKEAISFTGSQAGIITCNNHANARIIDVKPDRLLSSLKEGKIVIVAGFQGVSKEKEVTTLGREGSDTTAVAIGIALNASKVEFFKDVPGIFDKDPKGDSSAFQYSRLTYEQALAIVERGAQILHRRAIQLAAKNGLPLHVKSFLSKDKHNYGTIISDLLNVRRRDIQYE